MTKSCKSIKNMKMGIKNNKVVRKKWNKMIELIIYISKYQLVMIKNEMFMI